jgi:hypothetical protein
VIVPLLVAGLAYVGGREAASRPSPTSPNSDATVTSTTRQPDPPPTTSPTAKREYIRTADKLCTEAFQEAGYVVQTVTNPIDRFEQIILIHQGLVSRWGELEPPPAEAAEVDRILELYRRANAQATEAATAHRRGDNDGYYAAEAEGKRLESQGSGLAKAFGFRVCHQLGS